MDDRVSLRHDFGDCAMLINGEIDLMARLHQVIFCKIFAVLATKICHTRVSLHIRDLNFKVESLFSCESTVEHTVEERRLCILLKEIFPCVAGDNLVNKMTLATIV